MISSIDSGAEGDAPAAFADQEIAIHILSHVDLDQVHDPRRDHVLILKEQENAKVLTVCQSRIPVRQDHMVAGGIFNDILQADSPVVVIFD